MIENYKDKIDTSKIKVGAIWSVDSKCFSVRLGTWNTISGWQYGPEKEMGPTKKTYFDGTMKVDAATLQLAVHVSWNACDINDYFTVTSVYWR